MGIMKKTGKHILFVLLGLLVVAAIGYFVFTGCRV